MMVRSSRRVLLDLAAAAAAAAVVVIAAPSLAAADAFGGFSGVERRYLISPDRVCTPIPVKAGAATGLPACSKAGSDVIARLSLKDPVAERGAKARFRASASGRELVVSAGDGRAVVRWSSLDPIARVEAVYASTYGEMVAVVLGVRRGGRDSSDVVVFDLGAGATTTPTSPGTQPSPTGPPGAGRAPTGPEGIEAVPVNPALAKQVARARKARGKAALAAWDQALALDAKASEAMFGRAAALVALRRPDEAITQLEALASSNRADAIELLIAARFDKVFAPLRADPRFRAAVGYDRGAASTYERLMGFGGEWMQDGTSCDSAAVELSLRRDRSFRLRIYSKCSGMQFDDRFRGTWKVGTDALELVFPNRGRSNEAVRCGLGRQGEEDAITCAIDEDLQFTVLPARR